jgi:hypothetical protein
MVPRMGTIIGKLALAAATRRKDVKIKRYVD